MIQVGFVWLRWFCFLDTSFVDRNRAQQEFVGDRDNVIFYIGSALLGKNDSHFLLLFYFIMYYTTCTCEISFFKVLLLRAKMGPKRIFLQIRRILFLRLLAPYLQKMLLLVREISLFFPCFFFFFLKNIHMLSLAWE